MTLLGITDIGIWSAYLLCVLSTILCVGYGVLNWNKEHVYEEEIETVKTFKWETVKNKVSEAL